MIISATECRRGGEFLAILFVDFLFHRHIVACLLQALGGGICCCCTSDGGYSLHFACRSCEFTCSFIHPYSLSPLPAFLLLLCFSIHYTFDLHNRASLIASQYTNSFHCIPISMVIIIITTALCVQDLSSTPLTNALLS